MNLETRVPPDLWNAVRMNYERQNFTGSIMDAFYFLSELLRKKSGAEGDGSALIGQALGGAHPKIRLNRLQSESDWNTQKGVEQMLRGFYQAVRNPRSHEKTLDSEDDAQILIIFIGYIVRQIDKARSRFSRTDFVARILDPNFVPQERYANLLVDQIPAGQRLEAFLDVYRAKETGRPEHLRHFFTALLPKLSEDELRQVYEAISEELKTANDDATIRLVVGSLAEGVWPKLDEDARLRIENRLIRSLREGRYSRKRNACMSGGLATWGRNLLPHFSLKQELINAVVDKLRSNSSEEEDYVFEYFFGRLAEVSDLMPPRIESILRLKLRDGSSRFHDALVFSCPWDDTRFTPALKKALDEFKKADESIDDFDDDIPF